MAVVTCSKRRAVSRSGSGSAGELSVSSAVSTAGAAMGAICANSSSSYGFEVASRFLKPERSVIWEPHGSRAQPRSGFTLNTWPLHSVPGSRLHGNLKSFQINL